MTAMDVTAVCERSGDWWAISVPEVEGLFTQAKRLDQVPAMVTDAVSLLAGIPADQVNVTVEPHLVSPAALDWWAVANQSQAIARTFQEDAARASRAAVVELRRQNLPVRDVATLLGISPQRVSQLAAEAPDNSTVPQPLPAVVDIAKAAARAAAAAAGDQQESVSRRPVVGSHR